MNQKTQTSVDFNRLHEAAQSIFESLAMRMQTHLPTIKASRGRTATQKFPLYTHVTFEDEDRPEIDPIIVGIDVRVDTGMILVHGDIAGEELGTAYFDLPDQWLPFGTEEGALISTMVNTAQRLADEAVPILDRMFEYARPLQTPT